MALNKLANFSRAGEMVEKASFPKQESTGTPKNLSVFNSYYDPEKPEYGGHNSALLPLEFCREFVYDSTNKPSLGFYRPIANLAEAYLRNKTDYYFNNGNFPQSWIKKSQLAKDLEALKTIEYLLIYKTTRLVMPEYNEKEKILKGGVYEGELYIFSLTDLVYYGMHKIVARSSKAILLPDRYEDYTRSVMAKANADFSANITREMEKAVPFTSWMPSVKVF
jgi:hypothetical protein